MAKFLGNEQNGCESIHFKYSRLCDNQRFEKWHLLFRRNKSPNDKYVLLASRVPFTVNQNSFDSTDPLATGTAETVVNKQKGSLPSTGGSGIYLMMAAGVAVMAIVGVAYLRSQRKEA